MKTKIFIAFFIISCLSFSQNFNTDKDLLLANFDLKPDEDDVMAAAALASMLQHPDLDGVDYYAVAGAYGRQDKSTYITTATPDFFNTLFGKENKKWTDAHTNWNASVMRAMKKLKKVIDTGGKIFVQEAGQSDFTHDILQALLKDGIPLSTIHKNVIVVQHSKWNTKQTTPSKLEWVQKNTIYQKIEDGNTGLNGTPGYRTDETEWLMQAKSIANQNADTRKFWTMADDICKNWEASWNNKHIAKGGVDFSDSVENWHIFNIGDKANSLPKFWNRYIVKTDASSNPHHTDSRLTETASHHINSDGSKFVTKDFYPKFTWNTTPLYFMFGDKERVLKPEEVKFIADRTDFLCIEKSHGKGMFGAAELGTKHDASAFKKMKPKMKVLFYFNAALAWPYTTYCKDFTKEHIYSSELKNFLIKNAKTGKLAEKHTAFLFDVLNPKFRKWWVDTVVKGVKESGSDGVFIDQMHGNVSLRKDKKKEIEVAMGEMMNALKKGLGADKILLANNANGRDA